ncbi:MAG: aldehyde dehydrogenase (NADP(+)) [Ferruginibacter sp.]
MFTDTSLNELETILQDAENATKIFSKKSLAARAGFMHEIADSLKEAEPELVAMAMQETNLPEARLKNELGRTCTQLRSYADFCAGGQWMDIRIDTADENRNPPKPDIRKMMTALGPVLVFGASNFPFAYSTAGGDTACAFAAGCAVIVKAHPAHAATSELVAAIILKTIEKLGLPKGLFAHVHGASNAVGEALVKHPAIKAVGFTGSFAGGKQIFDWGNQRKDPIPVFAEMGSVNPVFLLPQKMNEDAAGFAKKYAASITLGMGQFCTKPGILVGIANVDLDIFTDALAAEIKDTAPALMLHMGISKNYEEKKAIALAQEAVEEIAVTGKDVLPGQGKAALAVVPAAAFIKNPQLQQEVFGPWSIIVKCRDITEMTAVAKTFEGQLTASFIATDDDMIANGPLVDIAKNICGRLVLNGVPTGVETGLSMQHGGPFPASTDSRFTSVGGDGIRRFARPVAYQNWPEHLLPDELSAGNPLGLWRTVNNIPGIH